MIKHNEDWLVAEFRSTISTWYFVLPTGNRCPIWSYDWSSHVFL